MKGVWRLIRRDLRHATRNTMAILVLAGLVVLPSLFTWFNVIASWNPFGNTRGLTVAVANTDAGYQSDLIPLRLNIGDQVVSALRANDEFTWAITSEEEAIDGTKSGEYYAAIVLPADFSQKMLTFYDPGSTPTDIDYYINEKKNALAPKITGQGATDVTSGINTVFTRTLSEVAVSILSQLSDYLQDSDTQALFTRLEAHVSDISTQMRSGAATADAFTALLNSSTSLVSSASGLLSSATDSLEDAGSAAGQGVDAAGSLADTLRGATDSLTGALDTSAAGFDPVGTQADGLFSTAGQLTGAQADTLDALATKVGEHVTAYTNVKDALTALGPSVPAQGQDAYNAALTAVDDAIARQQAVVDALASASAAVRTGNDNAQGEHAAVTQAVADAKASIQQARDSYANTLKPQLDSLAAALTQTVDAVGVVEDDLDGAVDGLSGASDSINGTLTHAAEVTATLSQRLTEAADTFDSLEASLATARTTGDLSDLQAIVGTDPTALATSLSSPVGVNRIPVYPVATFGSAMAPLYTVLALWVGALLMSVTIQTHVHRDVLPHSPELSPNQKYLGRYGIFALVGLAQATLLCAGNLAFVQVQAVHPLLYMLAGWATSLVFSLTIYTAVVAFGNAGKALCVLLLVIQISSANGAYPLQLLPEWFQHISRFMPATYAIDAFRSAIAGVYHADYWKALGILATYLLPALLLGLVLRKPLISFNQNLVRALESTKLM